MKQDVNHLLQTTDAKEWAKVFMGTIKTHDLEVTEELMSGWFANAIMTGYDAASKSNPNIAIIQ